MGFRVFAFAALAASLLSACGVEGTYYEATPKQVTARLKNAPIPSPFIGTGVANKTVSVSQDGTVTTTLRNAAGKAGIEIIATVVPDGEGSRVATSVRYDASKLQGAVDAVVLSSMIDKLAEEHVAAAVEKRPFDMLFATNPMAKQLVTSNPEMAEEMREANEYAREMARRQTDSANQFGSSKGGWGAGTASSSWEAGNDEDGWGN